MHVVLPFGREEERQEPTPVALLHLVSLRAKK